jgi:hypothetical protein
VKIKVFGDDNDISRILDPENVGVTVHGMFTKRHGVISQNK